MAEQRGGAVRPPEGDDRLSALLTNANAVRAVASAVAGTLGPKGLDCMLLNSGGDVIITNDGSTILDQIAVSHPAAHLLINAARAQEREVGDGTTTTTLLANALIDAAVHHVTRGVPVVRLLEGMRVAMARAQSFLDEIAVACPDLDDPFLCRAALVAGRGYPEIADLVVRAARLVGREMLSDPSFRLADRVVAQDGLESAVLEGVVIRKGRMNRQMPVQLAEARVLIIDDALEPEALGEEALATEAGFRRFLQVQEEFKAGLRMLMESGVRCVLVERSVDPMAEEALTEAGVLVVRRVAPSDLASVAELCGARPVKRTVLKRRPEEVSAALGYADKVVVDDRRQFLCITGGRGQRVATILVGASTREVRDERERIARDAASAVQAVAVGGVVPGGGAAELAAARAVQALRAEMRGMAAYGADCAIEALRVPLMQIVSNAGFNPLEKVEDVLAAQAARESPALAIDCDTGEVTDMMRAGVVDPLPVKKQALRTAFEVAEAILRIDRIIKKRQEPEAAGE
ncbi:MAG TPA: TCP-1/cpn60 chaperonin family protein [Armatimonadota bacterium]|nr:TCP-1/cpn60 chaperonin family protein [Armatimonadota bacterium]HOM82939.1 TCP-1/cpn60 chaperonin family protein [Armatimonadota bacterium]HOQ28647.1 TCP-1/cpn60 chaperonin family protein [Armatimonadota bacterium]HPO72568.1 TCP-1/cpn60 chaperonin family protein [Armatimonadota bacterium]